MTDPQEAPRTQIQVIDRAARLLEVLSEDQGPRRLREIARAAELSPSTARRILASLCAHGFCEQDDQGHYHLGLKLFELGSRVEANLDVRTRARPMLRRLSEETHLTAFICVRSEDRAIALDRIDGRYAFSLALKVGGSLPLHVGAGPLALLAFSPEDEARQLLDELQPLRSYTERTRTSTEDILAAMAEDRERGYVISDEDVTPGVAAIGMPIFGHPSSTRPMASVSVAGLVNQVLGERKDELIASLKTAADEISVSLGHGMGREEDHHEISPFGGEVA